MSKQLRALILEERKGSLGSLRDELRRFGYEPRYECVDSLSGLSAALDRSKWDVVIANGEVPRASACAALELLEQRGSAVPFFAVSNMLSEKGCELNELALAEARAGLKRAEQT